MPQLLIIAFTGTVLGCIYIVQRMAKGGKP